MKITNEQLELSIQKQKCRLNQRRARAARWFAHMRQVVERAIDWHPVPPPRPEQIWFPTALAPALRPSVGDERHLTE